jgi:hypothetical protein
VNTTENTTPPSQATINYLLKKVAQMLKNASTTPEQRENLRLHYEDLEDIWQTEDLDLFVKNFHAFMMKYLNTGNYDTWMSAFDILRQYSYASKDLQGFLISINTNKSTNIDLSIPTNFDEFLTIDSGLSHLEEQPVFKSR